VFPNDWLPHTAPKHLFAHMKNDVNIIHIQSPHLANHHISPYETLLRTQQSKETSIWLVTSSRTLISTSTVSPRRTTSTTSLGWRWWWLRAFRRWWSWSGRHRSTHTHGYMNSIGWGMGIWNGSQNGTIQTQDTILSHGHTPCGILWRTQVHMCKTRMIGIFHRTTTDLKATIGQKRHHFFRSSIHGHLLQQNLCLQGIQRTSSRRELR